MANVQHLHDWAATPSGWACSQCSATLTNAQVGANATSAMGATDDPLDIVWETVNGGP